MSESPQYRPLLIAVAVLLCYLGVGFYILELEQHRWLDERRGEAQGIAARYASAVERNVSRAMAAIETMESYLAHHDGAIEDFDTHSADLIRSVGVFSALELAPDGVVSHVFPLVGYAPLIGTRVVEDGPGADEARQAMLSRELTLSDAITLHDGEVAVIGRYAIYLSDAVGDELFWGFASVILKLRELVEGTGLNRLAESGYVYQLALSGGQPSAGDPRRLDPDGSVVQRISVPGGDWQLRLAPLEPWVRPPIYYVHMLILFLTGALLTYLVFTLLWQPIRLRAEVARSGRALRQANDRYLAVFNSVREVIFQLGPRNELVLLNPAWQQVTGFEAGGSLGRQLVEYLHPDDVERGAQLIARCRDDPRSGTTAELRLRGRGNTIRWVELEMHTTRDENGQVDLLAGSMRDVTERKRADRLIHYQAHFDSLTNLPNRKLFLDRFGRAIESALRGGRRLALMFVDLDRFKWINDSLGHAAGDQLLKEVAMRLTSCVRRADTVARFGGDEFVVLVAEINEAIDAEVVARKILAELNRPFELNGQKESVSGSIGITICPDDGREVGELLNNADNVMYHVKESGRNDFQFFTAAMNEALQKRHGMAAALGRAIENGDLGLDYQPIVALGDRRVVGIEALLRWSDPEFGEVAPGELIALAEDTRLIEALGNWILGTACRDFLTLRAAQPSLEYVTVNFSDRQFRAHAQEQLAAVFERYGLREGMVCIDINESLIAEDRDEVWRALESIRALGVRIMLDDFGTGLSSLSHLKRLAPDAVKVQSAYLAGIVPDASAAAMIGSIVAMAHSMDIHVISEGVEDARQAEMLELLGCDYAQGYHFCTPMPAEGLLTEIAGAGTRGTLSAGAAQPSGSG